MPAKAKKPGPTLNQQYADAERILGKYEDLIANVGTMRSEFFRELMDPRRDIDAECGYPTHVRLDHLVRMNRRNPFARRVNEVMAREAFQSRLRVWESDDPDKPTPFDESVKALARQARGVKSWRGDNEGTVLQTTLMRAAMRANVGHYAVILLGLNDGLPLSEPAAGIEEQFSMPGRYEDEEKDDEALIDTPLDGEGSPADKGKGQRAPKQWQDKYTGNAASIVLNSGDEPPAPRGQYSLSINAEEQQSILVQDKATGGAKRIAGKRELTYLRVYPESQAMVTRWEMNRSSPRYGQPVSYTIYTADFWDQGSLSVLSQGTAPMASVDVHWTRVIHGPGYLVNPDEVTSSPMCEPVWNYLMNLDKVFGASGEGYWKSCFTGISLETHPQLGTQVKVNRSDIRNQLENFDQGLQRTLLLIGMSAKTIAPSVVDPTPHIEANKQAICIHLGIPKRIFDGSERGELSSTQDEGDWDDKLAVYQRTYVDPYWVTPTVDRLIMLGVLAEPGEDGYSASFDDIGATSDREKAEVASLKTQTLAAAIAGNVFSVVPEMEYLTDFTGFMEPDEAEAVLDKAEAREQEMAEMGLNPDGSAPAEIDPETGLPIQPPGDLGAGKFVGATGGEDDEEEGDDEEEDDEEPPPFGVNRPRPKPQE